MPEQYWLLWHTSWFSLISGLFAFFLKKYDFAFFDIVVFLTSINYWCYPDYSYRRYLDIGFVYAALAYHLYTAYGRPRAYVYYMITGIGLTCFPIAVFFYHHNMLWASTFSHSAIHMFANMANIILYTCDH